MTNTSELPTVRLLGPVDVETSEGAVAIAAHGPRTILAALALQAGHAVSIDHLVDVLWGDDPPPSAHNVVQSYVSLLRRWFGTDVVVHVDHSYVLDCRRARVDALHFERLVRLAEAASDDPQERLRLTTEALRMWRGRPFGELADDEAFRLEAYRLDELRAVAMELSIDAELRLGHHELVVSELESAVREHPYRERLWFMLIEALALGERRVEALRTCAELRATLAEVGISVEPRIADLERRILAGEPITPS